MSGIGTPAINQSGGVSTSNSTIVSPIGQKAMVASVSVVIASDQSPLPVTIGAGSAVIGHVITDSGSVTAATLSAETTKVIGTVNQGTSPWVISGTVTASIAAAQTLSTVTTVGTVTTITNPVAITGSATGSAVPAGAFYQGINAQTALPTAATAGNLTGATGDKFGRIIVIPQAMRDIVTPIAKLTITASTSETTLISAIASVFADIGSLSFVNTSATGTLIDLRDSTSGTIRYSFYVPPTDMRGISFNVSLPQGTVNNNWTVQCGTSVSSIIVTGHYIQNK